MRSPACGQASERASVYMYVGCNQDRPGSEGSISVAASGARIMYYEGGPECQFILRPVGRSVVRPSWPRE